MPFMSHSANHGLHCAGPALAFAESPMSRGSMRAFQTPENRTRSSLIVLIDVPSVRARGTTANIDGNGASGVEECETP